MSGSWTTSECSGLLALLAPDETDIADARVASAIAQHLASCPTCAQAEATLTSLVAGYRRVEAPSLPSEVELRLLDQLCSPSAPRPTSKG
jgi:anti-sigma factor RsiW